MTFAVTRERIRHIEAKAPRKLLIPRASNKLRSFSNRDRCYARQPRGP